VKFGFDQMRINPQRAALLRTNGNMFEVSR
jgi:hypothetical protein